MLAENSGDLIFTLDFNLDFTYASPAIYGLIGYKPEEIIGKHYSEIISAASCQLVLKLFERLIAELRKGEISPELFMVEMECIRKDGSYVWVETKASVLYDQERYPIGILGASRDISKRKTAQDELRKLSRAVTQSPDLIFITDKYGKIEYVNPSFTKLTGYDKDEVIGKTPGIFNFGFHPKEFYRNLWDTILSRNDWYGEFRNKKKDGELYWESASISPIKNEESVITHFVAVKADITEQKRILEDLIKAKEKAEESDRLKSAFLVNMSHEIRTPMNGILGFAELLKEPNLAGEEQSIYIAMINKSGQRMLNLINNIVDISKIEAGLMQVHYSTTNINDLLDEIRSFFKPEAMPRGLIYKVHNKLFTQESTINTDKDKLYAILSNLVKNAIKFSHEGTIEVGCARYENMIEFYVKDTGIGIPTNRQTAIFERFVKADIEDRMAYQSAGLGLTISKSYVEMLGGKLWLESQEGAGSVFYFTIPANTSKSDTEVSLTDSAEVHIDIPAGLNVLIVEDDDAFE